MKKKTTRWCKQCKRDLPLSEFLDFHRRLKRGWRVTKCNSCAQENMRRWAKTSLKRFEADSVGSVDE